MHNMRDYDDRECWRSGEDKTNRRAERLHMDSGVERYERRLRASTKHTDRVSAVLLSAVDDILCSSNNCHATRG